MKYLTRQQATEYLRERGVTVGKGVTVHPVSDGYLRSVAAAGTGPQFRYLGLHPVYTKEDLDAWIEARRGSRLEAFLQHKRLPPAHSRAPAVHAAHANSRQLNLFRPDAHTRSATSNRMGEVACQT